MHKPMDSVIPQGVKRYTSAVTTFQPEQNTVTTADDSKIKCAPFLLALIAAVLAAACSRWNARFTRRYDFLIVAPGLKINFDAVKGLKEGLADPKSAVSSIYSLDTVEKTWRNIEAFKKGTAVRPPDLRGLTPLGASPC